VRRLPVIPLARMVGRLGWLAADLLLAQRRARVGFRRGLRECGLPPHAIEELSRAYPIVTPGQIMSWHGADDS
jgi:hypothetical protein